MTEALLTAHGLHAGYRRRGVLRGLDLVLAPFEVVGLVGENGSGKSTLLDVLAGARTPASGTVTTRAPLDYCPQSSSLPPRLSVDEILALFARALDDDGTSARTQDLLERFALDGKRSARLETLSGGERQKLSLVVTLLPDRPILLLDEPYQALDLASYRTFWDLIEERRARGHAILVVSHLLLERERLKRVLTLAAGVLT